MNHLCSVHRRGRHACNRCQTLYRKGAVSTGSGVTHHAVAGAAFNDDADDGDVCACFSNDLRRDGCAVKRINQRRARQQGDDRERGRRELPKQAMRNGTVRRLRWIGK